MMSRESSKGNFEILVLCMFLANGVMPVSHNQFAVHMWCVLFCTHVN